MKHILLLFILSGLAVGCVQTKKKSTTNSDTELLTKHKVEETHSVETESKLNDSIKVYTNIVDSVHANLQLDSNNVISRSLINNWVAIAERFSLDNEKWRNPKLLESVLGNNALQNMIVRLLKKDDIWTEAGIDDFVLALMYTYESLSFSDASKLDELYNSLKANGKEETSDRFIYRDAKEDTEDWDRYCDAIEVFEDYFEESFHYSMDYLSLHYCYEFWARRYHEGNHAVVYKLLCHLDEEFSYDDYYYEDEYDQEYYGDEILLANESSNITDKDSIFITDVLTEIHPDTCIFRALRSGDYAERYDLDNPSWRSPRVLSFILRSEAIQNIIVNILMDNNLWYTAEFDVYVDALLASYVPAVQLEGELEHLFEMAYIREHNSTRANDDLHYAFIDDCPELEGEAFKAFYGGAFYQKLWLYKFWARRYHERNMHIVVKLLDKLKFRIEHYGSEEDVEYHFPQYVASVEPIQYPEPVVMDNTRSTDPSDFIPDGYVEYERVSGDLNDDGLDDCVLIIKGTDLSKVVINNYDKEVDRNRRGVIILFNTDTDYRLADQNLSCFSSENEDGGVYFAPELAVVVTNDKLYFEYSHGRYGNWSYCFRFQRSNFELVGYESSCHRGPVVLSQTSVNFSTQKQLYKKNVNDDLESEDEKFEETWSDLKMKNFIKLSEIEDFDELSWE